MRLIFKRILLQKILKRSKYFKSDKSFYTDLGDSKGYIICKLEKLRSDNSDITLKVEFETATTKPMQLRLHR